MFIESIHYYSSFLSPLYPVPHLSPQIQLRGAVSAVPDPLGRHGPDSDLKPDDLSLISDKFACCVPPSGTFGGVSKSSGDGAFETCWTNQDPNSSVKYCWSKSYYDPRAWYQEGEWTPCTPSDDPGWWYAINSLGMQKSTCGEPCQTMGNQCH